MNLIDVLQAELQHFGVRQLFGIPGDFVLPLFEALQGSNQFPLLTLSHEPSAVFAADACARITNKPSAVILTYGAGALNAVNSVAQAYMEHVPLIVIAGFPAEQELARKLLIHHQAKTVNSQRDIYGEITACQVRLDNPDRAGADIREALTICAEKSLPVLIEFPRDAIDFCTQRPKPYVAPIVDSAVLNLGVSAIQARLRTARSPVILCGVDVRRFDAVTAVQAFSTATGIPLISTLMGRACLDVKHPNYAGIFLDQSDIYPAQLLRESDLILLVGVIKTDSNFAAHADLFLTSKVINIEQGNLQIEDTVFKGLPLGSIFSSMTDKTYPPFQSALPNPGKKTLQTDSSKEATLSGTQVAKLIHEELSRLNCTVPIISDIGDCLFSSLQVSPRFLLAPAFYASMGYAVPAAFGVQASTGMRPLVLVGDGAFQMTGLELGHCKRYGFAPIIVLFNNGCWEMIRAFSPQLTCTDLGEWDYVALAQGMGGQGVQVKTSKEFVSALTQAMARTDCFSLIEVKLEEGSRSGRLSRFANGFLAANNLASC